MIASLSKDRTLCIVLDVSLDPLNAVLDDAAIVGSVSPVTAPKKREGIMRKILIVGGGYAGFYTAWKLEKKLRRGEAEVTVVDPRPYMTYQPFLPEVMAGSIEARHAAVSLRRHLHRTRVIAGTVSAIDHKHRVVTVRPADGDTFELGYDLIVVTAGAVTRKFPVPGFAELLSLATALLRRYPELHRDELRFHLVEASGRILPEVTERPGRWVVRFLQQRGGLVHLDTQVKSATGGHVVLSTGEEFDSELIVWTAGNAAKPVVGGMHTHLPVDQRGFLVTRPDLRVGTDTEPVPDAWAAGDDAGIEDLTSPTPGTRTVPNAQHAVRQGKLLARNIAATLHGGKPKNYRHHSLGAVATLGIGHGIFQYRRLVITVPPAWLMHRGYHVLAVPSSERKVRVLVIWLTAA